MVTIAEGIEHEEQAEYLHRNGWRYGQGWLYGSAQPGDITADAGHDAGRRTVGASGVVRCGASVPAAASTRAAGPPPARRSACRSAAMSTSAWTWWPPSRSTVTASTRRP